MYGTNAYIDPPNQVNMAYMECLGSVVRDVIQSMLGILQIGPSWESGTGVGAGTGYPSTSLEVEGTVR